MDWIDLAQDKCWYANVPSVFIKCGKYLDLVEDHSAFRDDFAPWSHKNCH